MFAKKIYEPLNKALEEQNIDSPIFLQKRCFSIIKSGADMLCHSDSNTGKTTVLAIGLIQKLQKAVGDVPRAIVFVPETTDAALCKTVLDKCATHTDLRIFDAHAPRRKDDLNTDIYMGSDIVIGTAQRMAELYNSNVINLSDLKMFAIDDADKITRLDANAHLERLAESGTKAQFLLFGETCTERMLRFANLYTRVQEATTNTEQTAN